MKSDSIKNSGFSLVEVIVAMAIFSLLITSFGGAYLYSQKSTVLSGDRARANIYAEEGLEAVRNIRDNDFSNLIDGDYGLEIEDNEWKLSLGGDTRGIFTRVVEISTLDEDRKEVRVNISWEEMFKGEGDVSLVSRFTNWAKEQEEDSVIESCQDYCVSVGYEGGVCRANRNLCNVDEVYEEDGDEFCPGRRGENECCCY